MTYPPKPEKGSSTRSLQRARGQSANQGQVNLSEREIAIMQMIAQHGGGPVATAQLATLHWPPDVASMLRYQGFDVAAVNDLMNQYPAAYLGQRVELAKFLYRLARTTPGRLSGLHPIWQQVLVTEPGPWLSQAIERDAPLPEVFIKRARYPSAFVSSAAKTGLRRLVEAGMVTVDELPVRRRSGSGQYLYYLTAKGRRRLAKELGVEVKQILYRRPGQLSDFQIRHHLQCVDLAISVNLSCQRLGYRMVQEYTDEQLKRLMQPHQVTYRLRRDPDDPNSEEEFTGRTVPDYFCLIEAKGRYFAHLVEVDRGTITVRSRTPALRDFKRRVAILSALYKQRLYHQLFPQAGNSFRYLVITNGGVDARGVYDRVQSLKAAAEAAIKEISGSEREARRAFQRYWFARWEAVKPSTIDYFASETILDGKWWQQAGDDQPRALIW